MKGLWRTVVWAMLLVGGSAWAGAKVTLRVAVDVGGQRATGSLGSARNSPDQVQYIGCQTFTYFAGGPDGRCFARAANGSYGSCYTGEQQYLDAMRSVTPDAYVEFTWNDMGVCTSLTVTESSLTEPKVP